MDDGCQFLCEGRTILMKENISSRLLTISGGLMTLSALLMALCGRIAIGGCFLAAAACMFLSAYHFGHAEEKNEEETHE